MTLNLMMPQEQDLKPRITVFGVGGAGCNAVNNMIEKALEGVDFVVANTDAQALQHAKANHRVQMGIKVTEGLGAGARPAVGAAAAEESIEEIVDHLAGSHMCFITAGMGGGTGTGAAPIIAQAARELGVLTVGVVTKPFQFEGAKRMRQAEDGVEQLQKVVDTLIIIPNQNLFRLANEKTTFTEAFAMADDVLYQGVKGVTDLMVKPGLINLDFADVRSVMDEMGKAMMGTGEATGEDRAIQAAEKAIANPLLDEISLRGARGVLINITGSHDLTLFELDEAANRIREEVDPNANIIVGSTLDDSLEGGMRVSVVATGIDAAEVVQDIPIPRRRISEPLSAAAPAMETPRQEAAPAEHRAEHRAEPAFEEREVAAQSPQENAGFQSMQARNLEPAPVAEPSLFADIPKSAFEPAPTPEPVSRRVEMQDDLPPPVYEPAAQPQFTQREIEAEAGDFVAPRRSAPGTPSPEAMERLRNAVGKMPARGERPSADAADTREEKPRFGINSLINRMTGHSAETPRPEARVQPGFTQRPNATPETAVDEDQEKIEIPAFLRRQAN